MPARLFSSALSGIALAFCCKDACLAVPVRDKTQPETIVHVIPEGLDTPPRLRFEASFQAGPLCGPNAVYSLLYGIGVSCSYQEIVDSIPINDHGSTLQDLRACLEKHGVRCEVRKNLSPDDIALAPMPLILHLGDTDGGAQDQSSWSHFTVIYGPDPYSDKGYVGVDTTNGLLGRYEKQQIARNMSGYALVVTDPSRAAQTTSRFLLWLPRLAWGGAVLFAALAVAAYVVPNSLIDKVAS